MKLSHKIAPTFVAAAITVACYAAAAHSQENQDANVVYLTDMKPIAFNSRALTDNWRNVWKSVDARLGGKTVPNSVVVHPFWYPGSEREATSVTFAINGDFDYFDATIGVSDLCPNAEVTTRFQVLGDNKEIFLSDVMRTGDRPLHIHVPVKDVVRLELIADKGPEYQFRIWGNAKLIKGDSSQPNPPYYAPPDQPQSSPPQPTGNKVLRIEPSVLRELATDFKAQLLDDPDLSKSKPTLAIAAFNLIPSRQLAPSNADNVREDLSTALIKTKTFEMVERGQLEQALKELKIGLSDTFDSATAQKLGKLVSARLVLIGSISDRGTYAVINARLIDTQTGKVPFASSVEARQ